MKYALKKALAARLAARLAVLIEGVEVTGRFPCPDVLSDLSMAAIRRWPEWELANELPAYLRRPVYGGGWADGS